MLFITKGIDYSNLMSTIYLLLFNSDPSATLTMATLNLSREDELSSLTPFSFPSVFSYNDNKVFFKHYGQMPNHPIFTKKRYNA